MNDQVKVDEPEVTQNLEAQPESVEVVAEAKEEVAKLSDAQLYELNVMSQLSKLNDWKKRVSGFAKFNKPARLDRSWHNGELILTSERNKLSWEEVHASNNVIRKAK